MTTIPNERWSTIPGFPACYQVSSHGRVSSFKWGYTHILKPHFVQPNRATSLRYIYYSLTARSGKIKHIPAHLLVLRTFRGPAKTKKHQGAHLDCNTMNNRLDNLCWALPIVNMGHSVDLNRIARGERVGTAKLNADMVRSIRLRFKRGEKIVRIAEDLRLNKDHVRDIVHHRVWKHVR